MDQSSADNMEFGKKNINKKQMLRDVVAQGASKSRRTKNVCFFLPIAMLMLRETARKIEVFPEQANCNGFMVMSQRTGCGGCMYRRTSSRGLTPTRRRRVGRQGTSSPSLVVMP